MDEHQEAQDAANSAKDHVKIAAEDFKTAASAKAEEIRHAAQQKAKNLGRPPKFRPAKFAARRKRPGPMHNPRRKRGKPTANRTFAKTRQKRSWERSV